MCLKFAGSVASSVDPDQTPHPVVYDLGLHCLLRPVSSNTKGTYGILYRFVYSEMLYLWEYMVLIDKIIVADAQSDQGFYCPLTDSLDSTECKNREQRPG